MLTRRWFGACFLCAGVGGFLASEAAAQGGPSSAVRRKLIKKSETGMGNLVTLLMEVEVPAGVEVPRHTHPGIESAFVLEGEAELYVQGQDNQTMRPGTGFQVPAEVPHGVRKVEKPLRLAITYVVDKDKPLVTLAPG
ncbi:cupin domain-containing protein [Methylobacterium nigriterrae]|uniref:cupin domain-containing protein n=1 Tax=Methylobacterium nigriterrae TaxID=3127512 RepID=UPI0030137B2C